MRYRTLEIRWHDSKPISSCDFQPVPFKKARPSSATAFATQSYRLATAGEDNHVRLWMVHPHLCSSPPRPARVEYLATLSRHSAAVNAVRWAPAGDLLASAGDDGMVIIWAPSSSPAPATYGSDLSPDELANEKEFWRPRTTFRCTTMQVYDLAWSPTGEFLLTGSTDNTARVFAAADGKCVHEIAEHAHYVQGVAWDPLGEYIATQSSDRAMHIYRVSANAAKGTFEAHAVGRNTRLPVSTTTRRTRTPSTGRHSHSRTSSVHAEVRPHMLRSASIASDVESESGVEGPTLQPFSNLPNPGGTPSSLFPGTPLSTPASAMFPPPPGAGSGGGGGGGGAGPSSRRSSFSGSNAPSSPGFSAVSGFSRSAYGRSPSPMPALPAIRTPPSTSGGWAGRYRDRDRDWAREGDGRDGAGEESARGRGRSATAERFHHGPNNTSSANHSNAAAAYGSYSGERRHTDGARLYGDEGFSNFFRRLGFSPDGALLLTPAGTFEDPSVVGPEVGGWEEGSASASASAGVGDGKGEGGGAKDERGRRARPVISTSVGDAAAAGGGSGSVSSVYIYSRANFARPPIAQLPGHKKASVAVRFGPVLFELRPGVGGAPSLLGALASGAGAGAGAAGEEGPRMGVGTATGEEGDRDRDVEESMEVDLVGPLVTLASTHSGSQSQSQSQSQASSAAQTPGIAAPAPQRASFNVLASPAMSPADRQPPTPAASKPSTPAPAPSLGAMSGLSGSNHPTPATGSLFALPYRMLYAVVTMDTVAIYDTQQAGPVCLLTKLHYDEFTDLTWSPDGQCLMLSSRDGYCTLVTFDEILPTHHTQQAALQLQQIAAQHSVPISYTASGSGSGSGGGSGITRKRPLEPLTPATSVDGDGPLALGLGSGVGLDSANVATPTMVLDAEAPVGTEGKAEGGAEQAADADGPPKKKRRVALTRVGDL